MDKPNYILKFNDGLLTPKKESLAKDVVKILIIIYWSVLIISIFIIGFDVFREIPIVSWLCVLITILFLKQQGGHVRKPSPCELWFYDDYIVQYCERRYYNKNNIRREYYKFYYKDIKRCLYRSVVKKIDIYGIVEATFYRYNKNGTVSEQPYKHTTVDAVSVFYTIFEPNINFIKEIEEHSPIKVEVIEN